MKRINTLRFPILLCKGLYLVIAIAAICATGLFIHLQIDPQYYSQWNAGLMFPKGILTHKVFEQWNTDLSNEATLLSLDRISTASLYSNYVRVMCILLLMFLTIREFLKVIQSIEIIETFHRRNISSFQKICKYLLIISILSGITILKTREANFYNYSLQLTPLILSLAAFVMAEIFKQGNQLLEENQLTI